jgi:hypothetical protein
MWPQGISICPLQQGSWTSYWSPLLGAQGSKNKFGKRQEMEWLLSQGLGLETGTVSSHYIPLVRESEGAQSPTLSRSIIEFVGIINLPHRPKLFGRKVCILKERMQNLN